ncbi:MAG TPA: hypothetical protein VLR89_00700, partial [Anaerolineaceae bacterium]|nr:hypothetical protein [Anaerolineaceae bacterium]
MENQKSENKAFIFPIVMVLFLLGLFLRLVKADAIPFTRVDADLAWQALEISKLRNSGTSPLALYTGLTGFLFWITSTSNFFARVIPALLGSSLVFIPYVILDRKYPNTLVGWSLLLTLDPVLIIYSRQLYGPILAISALFWTLVLLYKKKPILAGIAFGMALLAGKYFWLTGILVGIYLLINYLFNKTRFRESNRLFEKPSSKFLISTVLSCVLVSSSFLLNPSGLTGITSGLVDLFANTGNSSLPALLPIFLLMTYSLYLLLPFGKVLTRSTRQTWPLDLAFLFVLIFTTVLFQNQLPGLYAFI